MSECNLDIGQSVTGIYVVPQNAICLRMRFTFSKVDQFLPLSLPLSWARGGENPPVNQGLMLKLTSLNLNQITFSLIKLLSSCNSE